MLATDGLSDVSNEPQFLRASPTPSAWRQDRERKELQGPSSHHLLSSSLLFITISLYNTMKTSLIVAALLSLASVEAFAPAFRPSASVVTTQQNMFSGSGTGAAEDDPEAQEQMEKAAKSMGMSVEEYQLGVKARVKLNNDLDAMRVTGGIEGITVERCGNNPPKYLEIVVTEDGKAKGKDTVQKEIVSAMKKAGEDAKKGRAEAQKNMVRACVVK